jgi:H3 lysine-79-specific histone-lysine N-methyltransferase
MAATVKHLPIVFIIISRRHFLSVLFYTFTNTLVSLQTRADVVLVNNQVFTPDLNESLSLLFLELKDSAKIVSLKPFISSSFKLNQRNLHSPLAILTRPSVRPQPRSSLIWASPGVFKYPSNSVSWTDNPGEFCISVVNRSHLIAFQSKLGPT